MDGDGEWGWGWGIIVGVGLAVTAARCFAVGSATAIPFATAIFDAAMSTDVLEHLLPHEVGTLG